MTQRTFGQTIADSLRLGLGYAERLLKDIPANRFARLAAPGGQVVESNHPAFVYGHLSLYPPRILEQLGLPTVAVPETFPAVFSKDARCVDDPDGNIYPPMQEITDTFFEGYRAVLAAYDSVGDDVFQQANPAGGAMAERFPTLGSMHAFYVGGHVMIHMGQLSAWRRMEGLGPA